MSAGVALGFSSPVPQGPPQASGKRRRDPTGVRALGEEGSHSPPQATAHPTALHSHLLATRGPTGRGQGAVSQPPPARNPRSTPPMHQPPTPPSWVPVRPLKPKSLQIRGSWPLPPASCPPTPRTPHGGKTRESEGRSTAQGRQGGRRETHLTLKFLSFFFPFLSLL